MGEAKRAPAGIVTRQLRLWHWVSAALSLAGLLLFAFSGLLLNHPGWFAGKAPRQTSQYQLEAPELAALQALEPQDDAPVPAILHPWAQQVMGLSLAGRRAEISADEIYIALPVPGGDGGLEIDRETGVVLRAETQGGWAAWLKDLHKGRNTGVVWGWFIDVLGVGCVIFALTGLGLLALQARWRRMTWPLAWGGLVIPALLLLLVVHG